MAIKQLDDGRIADEFEIGEEPHILKDALVMSQADYDAMMLEEVQAMKQARYDNWIAIVTAPPVEMPPENAAAEPTV
jgi:hypothetical protein